MSEAVRFNKCATANQCRCPKCDKVLFDGESIPSRCVKPYDNTAMCKCKTWVAIPLLSKLVKAIAQTELRCGDCDKVLYADGAIRSRCVLPVAGKVLCSCKKWQKLSIFNIGHNLP